MPSQTLAFVIVGLFAMIFFLVYILLKQQLAFKRYQHPKYGFLGKPLLGMVSTAVILAGLIGGVFLVNQKTTTFTTKADLNISLNLDKSCVPVDSNNVSCNFKITPILDGIPYGNASDNQFNVYWNFSGIRQIMYSEITRTKVSPSNLNITIPKGNYHLVVIVSYNKVNTKNFTLDQQIIL